MSAITQRIEAAQNRLVMLKDQLNDHLETYDDQNVTDDELAVTSDYNAKIAQVEKALAALTESEARLATTAMELPQKAPGSGPRPFDFPVPKVEDEEYVWRALAVKVLAHNDPTRRPAMDILRDQFGEDRKTQAVFDVVSKAASIPADTVTSGWASQLVQTTFGALIQALLPNSIYPGLRARGGSFTFNRNGVVTLPARNTTPTIAGSFIAQGAPIPVRQGAFTSISLTPKKMAVISTFTREISLHSTPDIQAMIREAIVEDTALAIDSVLLDAAAATTTRPASILNGVVPLTPAGSGFANMVLDLKNLVSAVLTGTRGNLRSPVWIMKEDDLLTIKLMTNANGAMPFKDEIAAGNLLGYPVIQSMSAANDTVIFMDAADFMTATGDVPDFSVSDQATLHMEDTTPLAIATVGTPNVVAAPTRSLWQTDSLGIRMIMDINWAMRRTGVVASVQPGWN